MKRSDRDELVEILRIRFEQHPERHRGIPWAEVRARLDADQTALAALGAMERTGGEPDVVGRDDASGRLRFCDCAAESPAGRRSLCYDREALDARKANKPAGCRKILEPK